MFNYVIFGQKRERRTSTDWEALSIVVGNIDSWELSVGRATDMQKYQK